MKDKLDKKLCEKYPKIFADREKPLTETAMCWGFTCGNGWYWLIDKLCKYLQYNIDHNNEPQIKAIQVKEKYGSLRFYVGPASDRQNEVIRFAEFLSTHICENCGSNKMVGYTKGYILTLCKKCAKKLNKKDWEPYEE